MDTRETQGILAMIKAAWPNFYRDLPKADLMAAVNLWQVQFAEYDVRLVKAAVHALIATQTEGFPPTIGAVKEQIGKLTAPHIVGNLKSCLRKSGEWSVARNSSEPGL